MIREAYETAAEESSQEARGRERQALSHGIKLLERLKDGNLRSPESIDAFLYISRLWTCFIQDLYHPDNGLPEKLRGDLISIGMWILREVDMLREQKSGDVTPLIEINSLIRDGLK